MLILVQLLFEVALDLFLLALGIAVVYGALIFLLCTVFFIADQFEKPKANVAPTRQQ